MGVDPSVPARALIGGTVRLVSLEEDRLVENRVPQPDISNIRDPELVDAVWIPIAGEVGVDSIGVAEVSRTNKTPFPRAQ